MLNAKLSKKIRVNNIIKNIFIIFMALSLCLFIFAMLGFEIMAKLLFFFMILSIILYIFVIYYIIHCMRRSDFPFYKKVLWIIFLLFGIWIAVLIYSRDDIYNIKNSNE